jgi:hypothetical protein
MIPCECAVTDILKTPESIENRCVFVLPLKTKRDVYKGLGLRAVTKPNKFQVQMRLETDGLMKTWRRFYENIKYGGDVFFIKLNRYGDIRAVLVRMTKLAPQFSRAQEGWKSVLDLEEVYPPEGYSYDENGDWLIDPEGDPLTMLNCSWFSFDFGEEDPAGAECSNSFHAPGQHPENCNLSDEAILDVLGDGSCLALYRFDGDINDISNTYNADSADNTYNIGFIGGCAKFQGNNAGIIVNNLPIDYNNFSMSFWINVGDSGTGNIYESDDGVSTNIEVEFNAVSNALEVKGNGMSSNAYSGTDSLENYDPGHGKPTTPWQFICVVFKSNHDVLIYIDAEDTSTNTNASIGTVNPPADTTFTLGKNGYSGRLDHLRFFNKAILLFEIQKLYEERA